ncbi:MAG: hypothetical protein FWB78_04655 [Treponema sp.]|nr:hypothetical protein [Treponema sp.]
MNNIALITLYCIVDGFIKALADTERTEDARVMEPKTRAATAAEPERGAPSFASISTYST